MKLSGAFGGQHEELGTSARKSKGTNFVFSTTLQIPLGINLFLAGIVVFTRDEFIAFLSEHITGVIADGRKRFDGGFGNGAWRGALYWSYDRLIGGRLTLGSLDQVWRGLTGRSW